MLAPRWRKVLRDLWDNKGRTLLVVLSIAVGVFAVGMIASSRVIMSREMTAAWHVINPTSASLFTDLFDEEMVWAVRHMPEVQDADARRSTGLRFKISHDRLEGADLTSDENIPWRNLLVYTYLDYDDIHIFKLAPVSGAFPPPEHEILVERTSLAWMGVKEGASIQVEGPNGRRRTLRVAGTVHDLTQSAASWTGQATAYVTPETMRWLGLPGGFDELNFVVAGDTTDQAHITRVAGEVRDKVERSGRTVYYTWIETPGRHPAENDIEPVILVLGVLGLLSLVASGFLVINTMQALLAQQTRQIGVMKAVGAGGHQILGLYYVTVLIFGLLALAIAVPLGALAAFGMTRYMAALVNFDVNSLSIPPQVLALEVAVGLIVPLLAALFPIANGVRLTTREALSDYGLQGGRFGQGRVDRLLERVQGVGRPMLLSLRNTFRRKGRLALTLSTLTLSGAIFIAVFSTQASLMRTLDEMYDYTQYDVIVFMERGYRIEQLQRTALSVPGVTGAETWQFESARRVRPDDSESDTLFMRAPEANTQLVKPTLAEGRWLTAEDENAIVVNTYLLKNEPDIRVGDELTLKLGRDESTWQVVGIASRTPPAPMAFVNFPYFSETMGSVGRAGVAIVATAQHDPASQAEIAKALEQQFERDGLRVASTLTSSTEKGQVAARFNILVMFLLIMAVLLAVVGAIGLMGTMSLNVLERTREVGVMRAIGATSGDILRIVVAEGLVIGLLSWLLAALLAFPLGKLLSNTIGMSVMQMSLSYTFSLAGVGTWLATVVILSTLASIWPARNASKVTVREVLAYE